MLFNRDLSFEASSVYFLDVERPEAILDLCLFEVPSYMLKPLLLPVCKDDKRSEDSALLQVEKLLRAQFGYLDVSPLLSPPLYVGFQNHI